MHDPHINPDRLDILILARLSTYSKSSNPSLGQLEKELAAFVEHRLVGSQWRTLLEERLTHLRSRDLVERDHLRASKAGEAEVKRELGVSKLPDWRSLKSKRLVGWSLGLPPSDSSKLDTERARAVVIREHYDLRTKKVVPTLGQVLDAWVWRELGFETDEKLTLNRLRARLLERSLSARSIPTDTKKQGAWLAMMAVEAPTLGAGDLQTRLVQRGLAPARATEEPRPQRTPPIVREPEPTATNGASEPDVTVLADAVQSLADTTTDGGRFNDRKVFIASVWRRLSTRPEFGNLSLKAFKDHLVAANQRGLLRLHRADLVSAMDPRDVQESEVRYQNATFHFIESQIRRPA